MSRSFHLPLLLLLFGVLLPHRAEAQFVGCENIRQITRDECVALQKFYEDTNGDDWFNDRGWLRSNQPCDWFGITCIGTEWPRNVSRIEMRSNNVGGALPGDLSFLPELRALIIENENGVGLFNRLSNTIPTVYSNLSNLEVLWLSHNELRGGIPEEFANLTSLRVLRLDNNQLTGPIPPGLGALTALETLDLHTNHFQGALPAELGNLTALQQLNLRENNLSGSIPPALGTLKALTSLDLDANALSGSVPGALSTLDNLFRLSLSDNNLSGAVPLNLASAASGLSACSLENNAPSLCIPDTSPYQAIGKTTICGLTLDPACRFCSSTSGLPEAECEGLEALFLGTNGASWTDAAGWLATDTPCDWAGISCTEGEVTAVTLPQNNLDGSIPEALGALAGLTDLDLSAKALGGTITASLGNLARLRTLDLSGNRMTGAVPLAVAAIGASAATCTLADNDPGLCIPDTPPFQALGANPICGLPLRAACLPASFAEFAAVSARPDGKAVVLTWETDRVVETLRFAIEQQVDGAFVVLGNVDAGSSATPSYTYRTADLAPGTYRFRIKQVAENGAFAYSAEVEVSLFGGAFVLEAPYPNPFRAATTLRFAVATAQPVTVDLYDLLGRRVRRLYDGTPAAQMMQTVRIERAGLGSGAYIIRLTGTEGFTASETILLIR